MWDDAVDRAIGEVAREMTAGEPASDLRANVMARLDDRARWDRPSVWRSMFAAGAIALVVLVAYRATRPAAQPDVRVRVDVPLNPDVRPRTDTIHAPAATAARAISRATDLAGRTRPTVRTTIAPSLVDTVAPPPLTVTPLALNALDAAPLDIPPLDTIAPIAVAPIGEGDRR